MADRIIFHIDVNSAYLSWTSVENIKLHRGPDLREIPSIIGGDQSKRRGVVLAKSISAKKFGIQTGEPVANALKKCPSLVMAAPNQTLYSQYSRRLMEHLKKITPELEQVSVDECYLDFTGIAHLYPSPVLAATEIKDEIYQKYGFTVNVGISSNKLLAKMASDFQKPNLVHTLFPEEVPAKMWPLPVEELFMAGHASVETLHKLGIYTIGELAATDPILLSSHLKSHGRLLYDYANGIDDSPLVSTPEKAKGIGNSTTLFKDAGSFEEARIPLRELSASVSRRLRAAQMIAGNICLEIKYHTFISVSHQTRFSSPTNQEDAIFSNACILFHQLWDGTPIRLLGIRCSKLLPEDAPVQLSLFDYQIEPNEKLKKLDQALDAIQNRYGKDAVIRGSLLPNQKKDKSS